MPIPASIDDLSTTPASNSPAGSESPTDGDGYLRAHGSFIAILRDKLDGDSNTGVIRNATFSGTMAGAASWSGLQTFAAGISVSTGGNVLSDTYTPTWTNVANAASIVASTCQYMRVGSVLTVSGKVNITPSAVVTTQFRCTLPVASDFASSPQCAGTIVFLDNSGAKKPGTVQADATNNEATFNFTPDGTSAGDAYFSFTYLVV